jgi:hypothetical protein
MTMYKVFGVTPSGGSNIETVTEEVNPPLPPEELHKSISSFVFHCYGDSPESAFIEVWGDNELQARKMWFLLAELFSTTATQVWSLLPDANT